MKIINQMNFKKYLIKEPSYVHGHQATAESRILRIINETLRGFTTSRAELLAVKVPYFSAQRGL